MRTNDTTILRPAHLSEATTIAAMSRLHVEYGLRWRWTPQRVKSMIKDRDTMALVATAAGEIAGFAIMRFGDTDAHLYLLAVAPKSRRAGIGRALLGWLEKSCDTAGIRRIRVELRESNDGALAFYRRLRYWRIGEIRGYYDGRESAVVLMKTLRRFEQLTSGG